MCKRSEEFKTLIRIIMKTYTIKTHRNGTEISKPHFYILNKGLNSGKPLEKPCPNCFVLTAETKEEKEFYYWITFGLWQSKSFHPFLRGSVIPFIIIGEYKNCIKTAKDEAKNNLLQFKKTIKVLKQLQEKEETLKKTLVLIKEAKQAVFIKYKRNR